jgi:hypothetical protein
MNYNPIIIGGDFGDRPKKSSIIEKMANQESGKTPFINGGTMDDLKNIDLKGKNFIIWMPNISNEEEKHYPKKDVGAVLIVSKVLHKGVTETDAISRIFKMGANAVITIDKSEKPYRFKVIDALGNFWGSTTDPIQLLYITMGVSRCYGSTVRVRCEEFLGNPIIPDSEDLYTFMAINHRIADKAESMGGRYFGNCSTRCDKLFPSTRMENGLILVSPRNIDKAAITASDMVFVESEMSGLVRYFGKRKPSVDTPVQLDLYSEFPKIKYMIHGHYYVYGAPFTETFYPCGDRREYAEIDEIISKTYNKYAMGAINLVNHGFLLYSSSIDEMRALAESSLFVKRDIGNDPVYLHTRWD